jgi:hypothetical protein
MELPADKALTALLQMTSPKPDWLANQIQANGGTGQAP